MKAVGWMTAGCVASWIVVGALAPHIRGEVLLGMLMPLLVATVSLALASRTYQRDPQQLTPFMMKAFVGKMIAIGVYVVVVMTQLGLAVQPFVFSFAAYFIALHLVEAFCLRRMFSAPGSP